MLRRYGYAHTKLVLLSIAETKNNARELVAPTIWAVSDLVAAHPQWAERASDWLAAFDKVDLGQLCAFAKRNKAVNRQAACRPLLAAVRLSERADGAAREACGAGDGGARPAGGGHGGLGNACLTLGGPNSRFEEKSSGTPLRSSSW